MTYRANIGGHAPDHLRNAFKRFLVLDLSDTNREIDRVLVGDEHRTLRWLIGQLWNCTDTLPPTYAARLGLAEGSTYAQAVRALADELI